MDTTWHEIIRFWVFYSLGSTDNFEHALNEGIQLGRVLVSVLPLLFVFLIN